MTEEEKRRQQATKFAATQERASAPKVQGAPRSASDSKVEGAPRSASQLGRKEYSAGADSQLRQEGKVEGAPRSASRLGRKEYSAGANSPLRQEATRLDGKTRSIGQSANNRPRGESLLQPSVATSPPSRNVAQTVSDFTAGSIDDNIIDDQLDGAQDDEKDLFDDIFGLDEEEEDEFNPNYLA